jgi:hypothetical protein
MDDYEITEIHSKPYKPKQKHTGPNHNQKEIDEIRHQMNINYIMNHIPDDILDAKIAKIKIDILVVKNELDNRRLTHDKRRTLSNKLRELERIKDGLINLKNYREGYPLEGQDLHNVRNAIEKIYKRNFGSRKRSRKLRKRSRRSKKSRK